MSLIIAVAYIIARVKVAGSTFVSALPDFCVETVLFLNWFVVAYTAMCSRCHLSMCIVDAVCEDG